VKWVKAKGEKIEPEESNEEKKQNRRRCRNSNEDEMHYLKKAEGRDGRKVCTKTWESKAKKAEKLKQRFVKVSLTSDE